jgi:hypothetical protein
MVVSILDVDFDIPASRVNMLVAELNQIETSLDSVAREIDNLGITENESCLSLDYKKLIDHEKKLSGQWSAIFEILLNFVPMTQQETSDVMVALIDLQLKGHTSEPLLKALKRLALGLKRSE